MTPGEIVAAIEGHRKRTKWDAVLTYTTGFLSMRGVVIAVSGGRFPTIQDVFPGMFDETPPSQDWRALKARLLAKSERGEQI